MLFRSGSNIWSELAAVIIEGVIFFSVCVFAEFVLLNKVFTNAGEELFVFSLTIKELRTSELK